MKLAYSLIMLMLAVPVIQVGRAQITMDSDYLLSRAGSTSEMTFSDRSNLETSPLSAAEADIITDIVENRAGANQVYDFSGVSYDLRGTLEQTYLTSTAGLPNSGDPAFANSNFVATTVLGGFGTTYTYYRLESDAMSRLGSYSETSFGNQLITYSPPVIDLAFPLTFGTSWTTPENSSLGFSQTIDATVDGYGTLILPGGMQAEALRLRTVRSRELAPGFAETSTTYEFLTREGHVATIDYEMPLFQPEELVSISYSVASDVATALDDPDEIPVTAALQQNYPNPFNPSTVIPLELSSPADVAIRVYDVMGRRVETVFEGPLPAGHHEIAWRPDAALPGGVYFYRLEGGGQTAVRSLQLIK